MSDLALAKKRPETWLDRPDAIETVCRHISCGGTLRDFCAGRGMSYADLSWWIQSDENRNRKFQSAINARNEWMVERIIGRLLEISDFSISDIVGSDGEILPPNEWPENVKRCIGSYSKSGDKKSIKSIDQLKAIELIGKQLGMFKDMVEHSGSISMADLIIRASKIVENEPAGD